MSQTLDPHKRGTHFRYGVPFTGEWVWSHYDEIKITFRQAVPAGTVTTDATETGVVAQATKTGGKITVDPDDDALFWVEFTAAECRAWPLGQLLWDCKGQRSSDPDVIDDLDDGDIEIQGDITRSLPAP
jgi:hypothetical protein